METLVPNMPALPLFVFFYFLVYIFAYFVVFRNWSAKQRPNASSCTMSLAHGTPAVLLAAHAILKSTERNFANANTPLQNIVLDYSIAYFVSDLFHLLAFPPRDLLFIGHHLATTFVFTTCRYLVGHGGFAILVLLVIAEITSGCQNMWALTYARSFDMEVAARTYELLSPVFYSFYSVARGVFGTFTVYKMGLFYLCGGADGVIPTWLWVSWMLVIVAALVVSQLWVCDLWIVWFRERSYKTEKKLK